MTIGIYDCDMNLYRGNVIFNLEAMKVASYYKKRNEIVLMDDVFSPMRHTKYFFFKDYNDGVYPRDIYSYNNINIYGRSSNNIYKPLPHDIERLEPDTSIYKIYSEYYHPTTFNKLLYGTHCRLSKNNMDIADNLKVPLYNGRYKHVILHDYDLASINGALDYIKEELEDRPICNKFPIIPKSSKDLISWLGIQGDTKLFNIKFNQIPKFSAITELNEVLLQKPQNYLLTWDWSSSMKNEEEYIAALPMVYDRILAFAYYGSKIKLEYNPPWISPNIEKIRDFCSFMSSYIGVKNDQRSIKKITPETLTSYSYAMLQAAHKYSFIGIDCIEVLRFIYRVSPLTYDKMKKFRPIDTKEALNE